MKPKEKVVFRVRHKKTGKWIRRNNGYGGFHWSDKAGTSWNRLGDLKLARANGCLTPQHLGFYKVALSDLEVVSFRLTEIESTPLSLL